MLESIIKGIEHALGTQAEAVTWWQLGLRTLIVYGVGLGLVRIGKRRFMGTYAATDVVIGITVGALLASAVNDANMFVNAIAIAFGLVLLHWLLAFVTFKWKPVGRLLIGEKETIVEDGEVRREGMRRTRISEVDLAQALRMAGLEDLGKVKSVFLERNGNLSIVPYGDEESDASNGDASNGDEGDHDERKSDESDRSEHGRGEDGSAARGGGASGNGRPARTAMARAPRLVEVDVQEGVQRVIIEVR